MVGKFGEPRSGDRAFVTRAALITDDPFRPFGARSPGETVTQGSQSLTLGLILTAAPQLVFPGKPLLTRGLVKAS